MTSLLESTQGLLAQRMNDWVDGLIVVAVVVFSIIGSLGKWIVGQIKAKQERDAQRRTGADLAAGPGRADSPMEKQFRRDSSPAPVRPIAKPVPPPPRRARETVVQTGRDLPPVMERVLEVILEKAGGAPVSRELSPPPPPPDVRPPPGPPKRRSLAEERAPKSPAQRERRQAKLREEKLRNVDRGAARLQERERQLYDLTEKRLGHVETHIVSGDEGRLAPVEPRELLDRRSLRDAIVLTEILAPPLALRIESDRSPC